MLKKIFAFLIEIPHLLIALMRYLFAPDWQFAISKPSAHYVKDRQLVSDADAATLLSTKTRSGRYQQVGKKPKGVMFRGITPRTTKIL